jgi:hypothetical protein
MYGVYSLTRRFQPRELYTPYIINPVADHSPLKCYVAMMHPMPPIEELRRFEGDAIAQVRLDPYAVQFAMESMWTIVAELRVEHVEPDGTVWTYDCEAASGPPVALHRLLYKRIATVQRDELRIVFGIEDGSQLILHTELGPYESGNISAPEMKDCFIVF